MHQIKHSSYYSVKKWIKVHISVLMNWWEKTLTIGASLVKSHELTLWFWFRSIRPIPGQAGLYLQALCAPRDSFGYRLQTQTLAVHMRPGAAALVWASMRRGGPQQRGEQRSPDPGSGAPLRPAHTHSGFDRLGSQQRLRGRRIGSVSSKWKLSPVGLEVSPLWNRKLRVKSPQSAAEPRSHSQDGQNPVRTRADPVEPFCWAGTSELNILRCCRKSSGAQRRGRLERPARIMRVPRSRAPPPRLSLSWCHQKRSGRLPQTFTRCSLSAAGTGPSSGSSPAGRTGPKNPEPASRETATNWTNAAVLIVSINTFKLKMFSLKLRY